LITTEQLLASSAGGRDRGLICGKLREKPTTRRNRRRSRTLAYFACLLGGWLATQPEPRGEVLADEAGFRLRRDPDTTVGADVAVISAEMTALTPEDACFFEGAPILAVEILSPGDVQNDIFGKIADYLDCGVKLVWLVEPIFRTITVFRPDAEPVLLNSTQELSGEPHLPGFRMPVAAAFALPRRE